MVRLWHSPKQPIGVAVQLHSLVLFSYTGFQNEELWQIVQHPRKDASLPSLRTAQIPSETSQVYSGLWWHESGVKVQSMYYGTHTACCAVQNNHLGESQSSESGWVTIVWNSEYITSSDLDAQCASLVDRLFSMCSCCCFQGGPTWWQKNDSIISSV